MAWGHRLVTHSLLWFPSTVVSDITHSDTPGLLAQVCEPSATKNIMIEFQARKSYAVQPQHRKIEDEESKEIFNFLVSLRPS